jgi:hypothetical protein
MVSGTPALNKYKALPVHFAEKTVEYYFKCGPHSSNIEAREVSNTSDYHK